MKAATPRHWRPLTRVTVTKLPEAVVDTAMEHYGLDRDAARAMLNRDHASTELWANDLYQVEVRAYGADFFQLCIRRVDGAPCLRDWRHFQAIKDQLLGPECEAVELYPATSRLVDTSNKYHLWGTRNPEFRFPIGFEQSDVRYDDDERAAGLRQRPL